MTLSTLRPLALVAAAPLLLSCAAFAESGSSGGSSSSTGGGEALTAQCRGDFGASAAAAEFEAFMNATFEFHAAAEDVQSTLLDACVAMGRELDMPGAELAGAGVEGTRTVCTAVDRQLQAELRAIAEASETTVELRSRPPHCEASFEAFADCAARCDVEVTPAQVELSCRGGEIRGGCSGQCSGRCAVEVDARCEGICEGACDGTCSARADDGSCAGRCDGTCQGSCTAEVSGSCRGECRGSCNVEWERPYCTGEYNPPQVNADCRAACEASVDARLECRPGEAELIVRGGPDAEARARAARVRSAVAAGYAQIVTLRDRARRLRASGRVLGQRLGNVPEAIRTVGVGAAACTTAAISDIGRSVASVSMSVEVSVSVTASVSAGASGGASAG
ncbi:MAG: hypothetical protein ACFCGT_04055 [Sandaracinaceae bacterium]